MSRHEPSRQTFYGPGIRAYLTCGRGECTVEIGVEQAERPSDSAAVEVTLQPQGSDGLPRGGAIEICRQVVPLAGIAGDRWFWGRVRLPQTLAPDRARECHLQVRPCYCGHSAS